MENTEGTYQKEVILPNLLRLMQIHQGEVVLDLGCGQGFFCRAFHNAGAKVIGVDLSSELIELARKVSPAVIEYHVGPAENLPFLAPATVDKIAIVLAVQNIEDLHGLFSECARVLKSWGKVFIVMNHPAFRIPGSSGWGWDQANNVIYRRIDKYMSESRAKIIMHPGLDPKSYTLSFHRPLQYYFKLLAKYGFAVTRLEEWISHKKSQPGPRAEAENSARKEIPLFLFLEATKVVFPSAGAGEAR
ncbi:MAG: class I SAM-dependent methyltransferase [Bacillota bacterium]